MSDLTKAFFSMAESVPNEERAPLITKRKTNRTSQVISIATNIMEKFRRNLTLLDNISQNFETFDRLELPKLIETIGSDIKELNMETQCLQEMINQRRTNGQEEAHLKSVFKTLQVEFGDISDIYSHITQRLNSDLRMQNKESEAFASYTDVSSTIRRRHVTEETATAQVYMEQDYMRDRTQSIRDLERILHQLGDVFVQMSTLIELQDEVIIEIETNRLLNFGHE
ncbi:hypothetical protein PCE1_001106 [Barthelona sp. PCE]